jgi:hypothetical protein
MTRNGRAIGDPAGRMTAEAAAEVIERLADAGPARDRARPGSGVRPPRWRPARRRLGRFFWSPSGPDEDACDVESGQVDGRGLLVADGDPSPPLPAVDAPFDGVELLVDLAVSGG